MIDILPILFKPPVPVTMPPRVARRDVVLIPSAAREVMMKKTVFFFDTPLPSPLFCSRPKQVLCRFSEKTIAEVRAIVAPLQRLMLP